MAGLPKHIAFIMDGNGRWAKSKGKPRTFGHKAGYENLVDIVDYAFDTVGIEYLSFYAFSTENWNRPPVEVKRLLLLLKVALRYATPRLIANGIRFRISGDCSMLKPSVKRAIDDLIEKTAHFTKHTLNICFNYGSRAEIVQAVNNMISDGVKSVDENLISKYLYTGDFPDPDLVVRTSGEMRLSNFMLWQSAYSELYFTNVYWPDFNRAEFDKMLDWFQNRERRFGK